MFGPLIRLYLWSIILVQTNMTVLIDETIKIVSMVDKSITN